ncbi:MAG: DNA polymerase III subunit gamma/tau [Immundisolibacteraceae bacterium]|nr:DNA polymerase III subunit gamma/tau [Immundisolibacteraceae bacterium]
MSYQVLARKWRPGGFADLIGQDHVRQALTNSLNTGRLHHAYLFTGTRGVGKTTIARILAKALNCEQGVSAEPCGQCSSCVEIDEGRFLDLMEIDAASRTKVDDTRDLLENVQYAPTRGRFKVYLIDEVHMFSKSSFNALLKTLEEPPAHVKFLLATTDPQKIPVTVLSRCLQFNLRQMSGEVIQQQLIKVTSAEQIQAEPEALKLIARSAAGSMRDGLSLLDQAIAFCGTELTLIETARMLGTVDQGQVVEMVHALHRGDANALLSLVDVLAERVPDFNVILEELLSLLHGLAVRKQVEDAPVQVDVSDEQLAELSALLSAEEIQLYYQLGLHGRRDLPLAPTPRIGLEMALLRMLAFQPERTAREVGFRSSLLTPNAGAVPGLPAEVDAVVKSADLSEDLAAAPMVVPVVTPELLPAAGKPEMAQPPASSPVVDLEPAETVQVASEQAQGSQSDEVVASGSTDSVSSQVKTSEPPPINQTIEQPASLGSQYPSSEVTPVKETQVNQAQIDGIQTHGVKEPGLSEPVVAPAVSGELPDWSKLAYELSLTGLAQQLAAQLALISVSEHEYCFTLDPSHRAVLNRPAQTRLEQALSQRAGQTVTVKIEMVRQAAETPAKERQRQHQQKLDQTTEQLQQDPTIKALEGAFGARMEPDSIESVDAAIEAAIEDDK